MGITLIHTKTKNIFISYSHDSEEHKKKVLELSNKMRKKGINCKIDQYIEAPEEGWPLWMEKNIDDADYVLIVNTEKYYNRYKGLEEHGKGKGIKWEGSIIRQDLYELESINKKFIPVILCEEDKEHIIKNLRSYTNYNLSDEKQWEAFYRYITDQPENVKPDLGDIEKFPTVVNIHENHLITINLNWDGNIIESDDQISFFIEQARYKLMKGALTKFEFKSETKEALIGRISELDTKLNTILESNQYNSSLSGLRTQFEGLKNALKDQEERELKTTKMLEYFLNNESIQPFIVKKNTALLCFKEIVTKYSQFPSNWSESGRSFEAYTLESNEKGQGIHPSFKFKLTNEQYHNSDIEPKEIFFTRPYRTVVSFSQEVIAERVIPPYLQLLYSELKRNPSLIQDEIFTNILFWHYGLA
nr:SEFIR domain-containing protein [Bacillus sp. FJAT-25509]